MAQIVISSEHIHGVFDKTVAPAAHAHSGDTAVFHCVDCYCGALHTAVETDSRLSQCLLCAAADAAAN